ncbi:tRNA-intron lyase [Methanohalophilus halophilus]|uniref:tRNA-splicing endonuclease n=1 Tax=Methanohalophilus halophilus TaxID=2177 RepID=A0A1L3Q2T4_9EURY|nr:tRNA-intron lyase [Methanohalophilus halophilus]APH39186.1 tRNA-intron lyase [Methanohalophilus halophilus]
MIGKLKEDRVVAGKEAIEEIYETSYYGRPKNDNLILTLVEAAHLLYREKLEIEKEGESLGFEEYFKNASLLNPYFELKYIVYKDLRERGFYVQPGVADFRVYPRGGKPGKSSSRSYVYVHSERVALPLSVLLKNLESAGNVRKQLIIAVVDEESDITYYEVQESDPTGNMEQLYPSLQTPATMLEDRVIVWDGEASGKLYENGFYGKPLDQKRLQLSLVEGAFLLKNNIIEVTTRKDDNKLNFDEFCKRAAHIEPLFQRKYRVYEDLRTRKLVPKTGFKFGTHFRVYSEVKSASKIPHSEYLAHSIGTQHEFSLPVMSRAIRLANSVRKKMLFAIEADEIRHIDITRVKM